MQRDMDLVREILLQTESAERPLDTQQFRGDWDADTVACHVELLKEAGFLDATILHGGGRTLGARVNRLTWEGHDFLDTVRDDTTWSQTKTRIAQSVGSASLEVVKAVATAVTLKTLGLPG